MSRAFVNEDLQSEAQAELPERPQSEHPNYVTPRGLASLERRPCEIVDRDQLIIGRRAEQDLPEHPGAVVDWY